MFPDRNEPLLPINYLTTKVFNNKVKLCNVRNRTARESKLLKKQNTVQGVFCFKRIGLISERLRPNMNTLLYKICPCWFVLSVLEWVVFFITLRCTHFLVYLWSFLFIFRIDALRSTVNDVKKHENDGIQTYAKIAAEKDHEYRNELKNLFKKIKIHIDDKEKTFNSKDKTLGKELMEKINSMEKVRRLVKKA